ncbi:MAG TPA: MAPEG family protein [Dongiaceae bacterium]|nr:MAPEG family protein [Dongiaceae bacterium]
MPAQVSIELNLLVWSVALCVLQMLIAVITAQGQVGLMPLVGNREGFPELKGIAGRARRAHENMVSNLVLFAALALVVAVTGKANAMTALGAQLFFWARLVYAVVYLIGIPWARTIVWAISIVGLVLMFFQLV